MRELSIRNPALRMFLFAYFGVGGLLIGSVFHISSDAQAAAKKPAGSKAKATISKSAKSSGAKAPASKGSVSVRVINLAVHADGRTELFDIRSQFDSPGGNLKPFTTGLRFGEARTISVPLAADGSFGFTWAPTGSKNRAEWFTPPGQMPIGTQGWWNSISVEYSPGLEEEVFSFATRSAAYDPKSDFDGDRVPVPGMATVYVGGSASGPLFDKYRFRAIAGGAGQGCLVEAQPRANSTRIIGGTDSIAYAVAPGAVNLALFDPDDTTCAIPITESISLTLKEGSLTHLEVIGTTRSNLKLLVVAER